MSVSRGRIGLSVRAAAPLLVRATGLALSQARGLVLAAGVTVGVGLLVGLGSVTEDAATAFRVALEEVTGRADVRIRGGEAGLPEALLDTVRALPNVAVATPLVRGTVFTDDEGGAALGVFGIDLVDDEAVQLYQGTGSVAPALVDDPLLFMGDPRSVLIGAGLAAERGLAHDSTLTVVAPGGPRSLVVRGILPDERLARLHGGRVLVMDVYAAARLLERRGRVDAIDVVLRDDAHIASTTHALRARLPAGLEVGRPEEGGADVDRMLRTFRALVETSGWLAVGLAAFLAHGAASNAVVAARPGLGMLRALGATRGDIMLVILGAAALLGCVGALAGAVLGRGLAGLLREPVLHAFDMQFALAVRAGSAGLDPGALAARVAAGALAAMGGAAGSAWEATRSSVMEVLRPRAAVTPARSWAAPCIGTVLVASGLALSTVGVGGFGLLLVGAALLARTMLRAGARLAWVASARIGSRTTVLAEAAGRDISGRSVVTATGLALSVALLVNLAAIHSSVEESVQALLVKQIRGDLVVSSQHVAGGWVPAPLAGSLVENLAALPGVTRVVTMRTIEQSYRGDRVRIRAIGGALDDDTRARALVEEGDPAAAAAALRAGTGVLVSRTLALHHRLRVGETIQLDTPRGPRAFAVSAILTDLSSDRGTITLDRGLFARYWEDDLVNVVELSVAPARAVASVADTIVSRFGRSHHLLVRDAAEHRRLRLESVRRAFAFTRAVEALTLLVVLLAFADNLLASLRERARELAILRAVGATRRQIAGLLIEEALVLGVGGSLFGLALGSALALTWLRFSLPHLIGFVVDFHFPLGGALRACAAALVVAVLAGALPAWRGSRLGLARELRTVA